MKTRIMSALLGLAVFLPFILLGNIYFAWFIGVLSAIAIFELCRMQHINLLSRFGIITFIATICLVIPRQYWFTHLESVNLIAMFYICGMLLLSFTVFAHHKYNFDNVATAMFGSIYVGLGFRFLIELREYSLDLILFQFLIIWATDIGAYFVGKKFGKHKLAPDISPNKTIEGAVGGVLLALIVSFFFVEFFNPNLGGTRHHLILTMLVSLFGQIGDLVESAMKRHFNVKDSGKILPGHGGILDRFDSNIFTSFFMMAWFTFVLPNF